MAWFSRRRALVASVSVVQSDGQGVRAPRSKDADWQKEAWANYHDLGEVRFSARYIGNGLARCRFFIGTREHPGDPIVPIPDDAPPDDLTARAVLDRIKGRDGTFASLVRAYGTQQFVAGESFLVGEEGLEGEQWEFLSTSELRTMDKNRIAGGSGYARVNGPNGAADEVEISGESIVLRFWSRDPEYRQRADSPMRAVLDICDALRMAQAAQTAADRSRLAMAGLFLIPTEADLPKAPDSDPAAPKLQLLDEMLQTMTTAMNDPGSAASVVPILAEVKGEFIGMFQHLRFDRDVDATIIPRIDHHIRRLAQGLDIPPEKLLGMSGVNHWTAWQISEETITAHISPMAEAFCEDLFVGFARPTMEALKLDTDKYAIGFDTAALLAQPNPTESALDLYDRMLLAGIPTVLALGFTEDQMPTEEEIKERMEREAAANPAPPAPAPEPPPEDEKKSKEDQQRGNRGPAESDKPDEKEAPENEPPEEVAAATKKRPAKPRGKATTSIEDVEVLVALQ